MAAMITDVENSSVILSLCLSVLFDIWVGGTVRGSIDGHGQENEAPRDDQLAEMQ